MKDKKVIKEVLVQVTIAVLVQVIVYALMYTYSYINREKINITVCSSTRSELGYFTSINIKNFQDDRSIDAITIWSSANIDTGSIKCEEFEVKGEKIIIKNIPPSFDGTIVLNSKEKITDENTKFESNEKRVVNYLYKQKEEISIYLRTVLITIITNFITYFILNWILIHFFNKKTGSINERLAKMKEENKAIEKKLDTCNEKCRKDYEAHLKLKIFLHRKLQDYAKELSFYKMLLKELIKDDKKGEEVCHQVTKELKTFKTMEKIDIEDLELSSLELSKIEKKQIDKELGNFLDESNSEE
ncbi:MAG: hypothetical protein K6B70_06600 [Clostridia bacterium]|nr:hypothetical protein [Clostridia bacterium]